MALEHEEPLRSLGAMLASLVVLRDSDDGARPLKSSTVNTVCLLVLAAVGSVWVLLKLASVLVPLTFAIFLAFLMEPVLSAFVRAPGSFCSFGRNARRPCVKCWEAASGPPASAAGAMQLQMQASLEAGALAAPSTSTAADAEVTEPLESRCGCLTRWLQGVWEAIAILLVVGSIVLLLWGVIAAVVEALTIFDWAIYEKSPKLKELADLLEQMGINVNEIMNGSILARYRGELMQLALEAAGVLQSIMMTLLLFIFALVAMLPGIRKHQPRSPVRTLMQRYLVMKTIASAVIAGAVMLSLCLLDVKLVIIFGLITFSFNFIPNIGSFFAILAPLPLALLEPDFSTAHVAYVAIIPFLIHNTLGNLLEPKLMASGLELHPLTVVVALTFWGSMWGIAGAILSVPITCAIRLWLQSLNHPYATTIHRLLDEPLGPGDSARLIQKAYLDTWTAHASGLLSEGVAV